MQIAELQLALAEAYEQLARWQQENVMELWSSSSASEVVSLITNYCFLVASCYY